MPHEVPPLPYDYNALEPHIDEQTMRIHHDKHHAAYVTNLNAALEKHPQLQQKSLDDLLRGINSVPEDIRTAVRNNGGGHANHTMFWEIMGPGKGGTPSGAIGEAISYALNHWEALIRPLEVGFLELDNGASERALKPVALGRKNWLFAGSDNGGRTAAVLMSLCATCKAWDIDPFAYLRDVLERVSTHPNSRIEELLPDRWKPAESTEAAGRKG